MRPDMDGEGTALNEAFCTHRAVVRSFIGMGSIVPAEARLPVERLEL